jgi:cellobiose phosphorylase
MIKRTTPWGEIKLIESGHGFCFEYFFFASDQQLYFFMLLSAYLRVTGDHEFLFEETHFYPFKNMPEVRVIDAVEACFGYLRDIVGTGKHGLIRLLNADWNDVIYHVTSESYNKIFYDGESHMNATMAVVILKDLVNELEVATRNKGFEKYSEKLIHISQSMELLRQKVLKAFMADLGDRKFSKRMYFAGKFYGEENMFLEPQGFLLQMNELPVERKKVLYKEMQERVYKNEKIGARQQESPQFDDEEFEKGSRENGGIWWALNGPVILGVAQFDKEEAYRLLKNLSFDNFIKHFPNYWTSYWSQADNFESSIMPGEGLADQSADYPDSPVFCAHAHAWPLYCYFRLHD